MEEKLFFLAAVKFYASAGHQDFNLSYRPLKISFGG
jgi:hypothetical protein